MTNTQKGIIFVGAMAIMCAGLHLWLGISSYPSLNTPAAYVMHSLVGFVIGCLLGLAGIAVYALWKHE